MLVKTFFNNKDPCDCVLFGDNQITLRIQYNNLFTQLQFVKIQVKNPSLLHTLQYIIFVFLYNFFRVK